MVFPFFEHVCQNSRTRGAVALAEDEFGRVPAAVLGDEACDEARKCIGVLIHAPEGLLRILADQPPKASAGHVDEDEVADVEKRVALSTSL